MSNQNGGTIWSTTYGDYQSYKICQLVSSTVTRYFYVPFQIAVEDKNIHILAGFYAAIKFPYSTCQIITYMYIPILINYISNERVVDNVMKMLKSLTFNFFSVIWSWFLKYMKYIVVIRKFTEVHDIIVYLPG